MPTIDEQLTELVAQKNSLAANLNTMGVTASESETLNTLVPKVLDIPTGGSSAVVQPLSVAQNGTYNPPSGVDGFSPVIVNVSGGGGDDWSSLKSYIQSSGTQYIDTGYFPNDNTNVEAIASVSRGSNSFPTIFGMRPQNYAQAGSHDLLIHFYSSSDYATLFRRNIGVGTANYAKYVDKKVKYVLGKKGYSVETDSYGFKDYTELTGSISSAYSLYIFNFNNMGSSYGSDAACIMKLYRMRIFEDNTLLHEYIPWQENGVACLKDTVTSNLLYNAGTGNFVYGTDA